MKLAILLACAFAAALLAFPALATGFYLQLLSKILILAVFALSLDLLVGHGGMVSLGHAAYFGLGGYVLALMTPQYEAASLWATLPAAVAASALYALLVGLLVLRSSGVYFIMATLAFSQLLYFLFHDTALGGGSDGLYIHLKPLASVAGVTLIDLESPVQFYYLVLAVLGAVLLFLFLLLRSSFGRALAGIRVNESRMHALGYATFHYRLAAFVTAGAIAGLAGYLAALQYGFVSPELLSWHQSGAVLMMVILGGMGRLHGPVLGAFAFVLLQELFSHQAVFGAYAKHWQLAMGLSIIAVALFLPQGLAGLGRSGAWPKRQDEP
jgi:branched-chain amino acid transport system permease protein